MALKKPIPASPEQLTAEHRIYHSFEKNIMTSAHYKTAFLLVALLVIGCSSTSSDSDSTLKSFPARNATDSVSCKIPCDVEWQRAQDWLAKHSKWSIQSVADTAIQTEYPTHGEPSYGFSVTRLPDRSGGYVIRMYMGCGNRSGCDVNPSRIKNAFYLYITTGADSIRNTGTRWVSIR